MYELQPSIDPTEKEEKAEKRVVGEICRTYHEHPPPLAFSFSYGQLLTIRRSYKIKRNLRSLTLGYLVC